MNVTFVQFLIHVMPAYSHGIASIAASLVKNNHSVELISVRDTNYLKTVNEILATKPNIICLSFTSNQYAFAKALASYIKSINNKIPIWAGGSHFISSPFSINETEIDNACFGEGEELLPLALNSFEAGSYFSNNSWLTNPINKSETKFSIVDNLDSIPEPLIQLFEKQDVMNYPSLMFSRGCTFNCSYCLSRKGGVNDKVRWKSVDRALTETKQLLKYFNPDELYFDDDTFLKNPSWLQLFLKEYGKLIKRPFFCNSRPELITAKLCKLLSRAGCVAIGIGLESGSKRIRKDILNRNMSDSTIKRAFDTAHDAGLKTWSFNMIGLPSETPEELISTIELNDTIQNDYVRVSVYTPYPGTPLSELVGKTSNQASYFDGIENMKPDLREIAKKWIDKLHKSNRLWNDE